MSDQKENWLHIPVSTMAPSELMWLGPSIVVTVFGDDAEYNVLAQIDSGCGHSGVGSELGAKLGSGLLGETRAIHFADHPVKTFPITRAFFRLPKGPKIELEFAVLESLGAPHEVLLGRDFLKFCRFSLDMPASHFDLHVGLHLLGMKPD